MPVARLAHLAHTTHAIVGNPTVLQLRCHGTHVAHIASMTNSERGLRARLLAQRCASSVLFTVFTAACAGSATTAAPGAGGGTGAGGTSFLGTGGSTRVEDPVTGGSTTVSSTNANTGGQVAGGASASQGGASNVETSTGGSTNRISCPSIPSVGGDCDTPGQTCEYRYELQCEPGCYGGDMHRLVCEQGKWNDTHTAGAPQCYCQDSGSP